MKVSFEFTTENESRSTMLLVAEFCNALAGDATQPVLNASIEPEAGKQPIKTVAEIIAEERAKTASMKAKAPAVEEPEQISEEAAELHEERKAEEEVTEQSVPQTRSRKKAEAVAKRAAEKAATEEAEAAAMDAAKKEAERQAEAAKLEDAKKEAKRISEAMDAAKKEAAPEQTNLTVKDCRDLAMKALNKQRKDLIQEAFALVGCTNFPMLEKHPDKFAAFMEHINTGLNE